MGIQGLLPFLKKAHKFVNIKQFEGCTVAIDTYCWLHKGAFACVEKLANKDQTDQYVRYCMKYVNQLRSFGVKPILVFDGSHLPSKKLVEQSRRERRSQYRKKAAQFLREGKKAEARQCLERAIDVTPEMALEVMKEARKKGVDCIVAPYEADAQLAFLNKAGIAQIVITEDSDLILFGCDKVFFKMDLSGNGILIENSDLYKAGQIKESYYSFDSFRYMCILSGCDYLPSLPGIGLGKASKVFSITKHADIRLVLKKLPMYLKNSNLVVPEEYIEGFVRAVNTFLYQLVFDPIQKKLVPLHPYPPDIDSTVLEYAGPHMSQQRALQHALGNINVNTGDVMDNFNPDTYQPAPVNSRTWDTASTQSNLPPHMLSIWSAHYKPMPIGYPDLIEGEPCKTTTVGMEITVNSAKLRQKAVRKRIAKECTHQDSEDGLTNKDLVDYYNTKLEECTEAETTTKQLSNGNSSQRQGDETSPRNYKRQRIDCGPSDKKYEDNVSQVPEMPAGSSMTKSKLQQVFKMSDRLETKFVSDNVNESQAVSDVVSNVISETMKAVSHHNSPHSWQPPRNIFAVCKEGKPKFDLNAKKKDITMEVKSRFFSKVSKGSKDMKITEVLNGIPTSEKLVDTESDQLSTMLNKKQNIKGMKGQTQFGAFPWTVKSEVTSSVDSNFVFKPVMPQSKTLKSPKLSTKEVSILSVFKRQPAKISKMMDSQKPSQNTSCTLLVENTPTDEKYEDEILTPNTGSTQKSNANSFTLSQSDLPMSQSSWKISFSQPEPLVKELEVDLQESSTWRYADVEPDTHNETNLVGCDYVNERPSVGLSTSHKLGMLLKGNEGHRSSSFYRRQSGSTPPECSDSMVPPAIHVDGTQVTVEVIEIDDNGDKVCSQQCGDETRIKPVVTSTSLGLTGGKSKLTSSCRSVGLSKKRKSRENLNEKNVKQASIKNFFAKFQHNRSKEEMGSACRKLMSPSKTNILQELTPEGDTSEIKVRERTGVHRRIL